MSKIRDRNLAPSGEMKIEWAARHMPVLKSISEDFAREKPFEGVKIALSIHFEAKTAYLCRVLALGGAEMCVTGSNPLSTQDDVAAAVAEGGIDVNAVYGVSGEEYEQQLCDTLKFAPNIIIDDGGDLVNLMHTKYTELVSEVYGGCEETTTGIYRLRSMARAKTLRFPMLNVNDADCKHLFDNRYGTGQSVWDGINSSTNLVIAGKSVVVAGFGWCGKGVAMRAKGQGARVIVTEIDPVKAIEANMEGFEVMPMSEAAKLGDVFVTVTGCSNVIGSEHFSVMKDGAILCNAGHFDVEVNVTQLRESAKKCYEARHNVEGFVMPNGRTIFLIAEGRLVNLAAGDGHPAEIMDMSFAIQALTAKYISENKGKLPIDVVPVPTEIDNEVARRKLRCMGTSIDILTDTQRNYLGI